MNDAEPHMVGHVHLKVRELEPAISFYTDVLGLTIAERHGRYAFLSWGERHHDVALQEIGADAPGPSRGVGLYHAAFEVETKPALTAIYDRLRARDQSVSPVDHGISLALYFSDPSGNGLEVYFDTRDSFDREAWNGRNAPFDPHEITDETTDSAK